MDSGRIFRADLGKVKAFKVPVRTQARGYSGGADRSTPGNLGLCGRSRRVERTDAAEYYETNSPWCCGPTHAELVKKMPPRRSDSIPFTPPPLLNVGCE